MKCLNVKRALGEESIEATLMACIEDKEPIDALDGFVFRQDQATEIALELLEGLRRKHGGKKGGIMLDDVGNVNQR